MYHAIEQLMMGKLPPILTLWTMPIIKWVDLFDLDQKVYWFLLVFLYVAYKLAVPFFYALRNGNATQFITLNMQITTLYMIILLVLRLLNTEMHSICSIRIVLFRISDVIDQLSSSQKQEHPCELRYNEQLHVCLWKLGTLNMYSFAFNQSLNRSFVLNVHTNWSWNRTLNAWSYVTVHWSCVESGEMNTQKSCFTTTNHHVCFFYWMLCMFIVTWECWLRRACEKQISNFFFPKTIQKCINILIWLTIRSKKSFFWDCSEGSVHTHQSVY